MTATLPTSEPAGAVLPLAALVERFGNIDARRLRLDRYPADEQDVLELRDRERRLCELVDGILVEKTKGYNEGYVAVTLSALLKAFTVSKRLGAVNGADGMMKLAPGLVRIPDVSFVKWEQFPDGKLSRAPIPSIHPDLAVEVLSQANTAKEMEQKRLDYFESGATLVWFVDPEARTVAVYNDAASRPTILKESDQLVGDPVLPGFSVLVATLFEDLPA